MNMTLGETVQLIVAVMIADVLGRGVEYAITQYRNRGKPECELCRKVRVTQKTKDGKFWTCRQCRKAYYLEHSL